MNFYIHIPFCRQKCPYCKFALTPIFDDLKKRRYLAHLKKEITEYFGENPVSHESDTQDTIYFGGGTPSIISLDEVGAILECCSSSPISQVGIREVSFECNPEDITEVYFEGLLRLGINRISLGVQSLNPDTLRAIHRSQRDSIFRALDSMQSCIFNTGSHISINVDFILGLPYSRYGETLENIRELHEKYPDITHTSVYMLEDGMYPSDWKNHSLREQEIEDEYTIICDYFRSIGWHHYEISNWSKYGYECRHNLGYWKHENYRGFGLSATSFYENVRWENSHSFILYYQGKKEYEEHLSPREIALEKIIYGLRTFSQDKNGFDTKILKELEKKGWISPDRSNIILTPSGIFRENTILSELIAVLPP